jgi:hypothetical protein
MTARIQACRSLVVLYLVFLAAQSLEQFYYAWNWPTSIGIFLRVALLGVFIWKILTQPKSWSSWIGVFLALQSLSTPVRLYLYHHSHPYSFLIIRLGRHFTQPSTMMWLFCVAPAICTVACLVWRQDLMREMPDQAPDVGVGRSLT